MSATYGAKGSLYRPSTWTLVCFALAFALIVALAYRSVELANKGQEQAQNDAALARIAAQDARNQLDDLQTQFNCVIRVLVDTNRGNIANSIAQDDILLGGVTGIDRTQYAEILTKARARLLEISQQIDSVDRQCNP